MKYKLLWEKNERGSKKKKRSIIDQELVIYTLSGGGRKLNCFSRLGQSFTKPSILGY